MSPSTPASRADAVADVLNGANTADVAEEHGVKEPTVERWVREHHETGEALDHWAREQHQEVRAQNERDPDEPGREAVIASAEDEATIDPSDISAADEANTAALLSEPEGESPEGRDPRVAEELAKRSPEDTAALLGIRPGQDRRRLDQARNAGDAEGESPEENDPGVATERYDDGPADSAVPFLARDANDPHPSSHGSLSATVNDPSY